MPKKKKKKGNESPIAADEDKQKKSSSKSNDGFVRVRAEMEASTTDGSISGKVPLSQDKEIRSRYEADKDELKQKKKMNKKKNKSKKHQHKDKADERDNKNPFADQANKLFAPGNDTNEDAVVTSIFGSSTGNADKAPSIFGTTGNGKSIFDSGTASPAPGGSIFGNAPSIFGTGKSIFGSPEASPAPGGSIFGNAAENNVPKKDNGGSIFGPSIDNKNPFAAQANKLFAPSIDNKNPFAQVIDNKNPFAAQANKLFAPAIGNKGLLGGPAPTGKGMFNGSIFGSFGRAASTPAGQGLFGSAAPAPATQGSPWIDWTRPLRSGQGLFGGAAPTAPASSEGSIFSGGFGGFGFGGFNVGGGAPLAPFAGGSIGQGIFGGRIDGSRAPAAVRDAANNAANKVQQSKTTGNIFGNFFDGVKTNENTNLRSGLFGAFVGKPAVGERRVIRKAVPVHPFCAKQYEEKWGWMRDIAAVAELIPDVLLHVKASLGWNKSGPLTSWKSIPVDEARVLTTLGARFKNLTLEPIDTINGFGDNKMLVNLVGLIDPVFLVKLNLQKCDVSSLSPVASCQNLKSFDFSGSRAPSDELQALGFLRNSLKLENLNVALPQDYSKTFLDASVVSRMDHLRTVHFSSLSPNVNLIRFPSNNRSTYFTCMFMRLENLEFVNSNPNLVSLSLIRCTVAANDFGQYGPFPKLTGLDLQHTKVQNLAPALSSMSRLQRLEVAGAFLSTDCAVHIAFVAGIFFIKKI